MRSIPIGGRFCRCSQAVEHVKAVPDGIEMRIFKRLGQFDETLDIRSYQRVGEHDVLSAAGCDHFCLRDGRAFETADTLFHRHMDEVCHLMAFYMRPEMSCAVSGLNRFFQIAAKQVPVINESGSDDSFASFKRVRLFHIRFCLLISSNPRVYQTEDDFCFHI